MRRTPTSTCHAPLFHSTSLFRCSRRSPRPGRSRCPPPKPPLTPKTVMPPAVDAPLSAQGAPGAGGKTSDAVLDHLTRLHPKVIDLSLGRVERLLARLGHPEAHLAPVVHVAGTNGKGSLPAFLRAMLEAAGQRSEESRGGKECVSKRRSRGGPYHKKKKT